MEKLPERVSGFNALSPQQQEAHRARIGVRAEAILGQFWRDDATPDAVRAVEIEGWMDVLENCSHSEIRRAWTNYQRTGPRTATGKLYKPDAGALYHLILVSRPKPKLAPSTIRPATQEENEAIAAECFSSKIDPAKKAAAEKIIRDAGISLKGGKHGS